jgi:hypothetical protein
LLKSTGLFEYNSLVYGVFAENETPLHRLPDCSGTAAKAANAESYGG